MMSRIPRRVRDVSFGSKESSVGLRKPAGMKRSTAWDTAHVSSQVGACVALKYQVVSEDS